MEEHQKAHPSKIQKNALYEEELGAPLFSCIIGMRIFQAFFDGG